MPETELVVPGVSDEDVTGTLMNVKTYPQYLEMVQNILAGKCVFCDPLARRANQAAPPAIARPSTSDRLWPASAIRAVEPLNSPAPNSTATKARLTIRPTA